MAEIEAQLAVPPFPVELGYLWRCFIRLARRTPAGFAGPTPITFLDLDAFIRRTGIRLAPWEVELIERLDDLRLHPADAKAPPAPDGQVRELASTSDGAGVKALIGGLGRRVVVRRKQGGVDA